MTTSGPLEVLVVDDNRIMRDMVARSVQMSGLPIAHVRQAADGKAALEALRSAWTDLVLLDLNMPVMDGETFLRELRQDTAIRDTLVVVVSTEGSGARIDRLRALGAGFVHKPFTPEALIGEVQRLIGNTP
jgi:two-component system, chemotaxis family, chemotaxis protein CheY